MTEVFLLILTTVIVVVAILWHRQISLGMLQVIAGRRIKRPFLSAEDLEALEIECKIIEDPKPFTQGGVIPKPPTQTTAGMGPIPARVENSRRETVTRKTSMGFTVTSTIDINVVNTPGEQIAAAIINQQRRAHHG